MKLIPLKETKAFLNSLLICRRKKGKHHFFSVECETSLIEEKSLKALRGDNDVLYVFSLKACELVPNEYPNQVRKTVAAILIAMYDDETDHYNPGEVLSISDQWLEVYSVDNHQIGKAFTDDGMLNNHHNAMLFRNIWNNAAANNKPLH